MKYGYIRVSTKSQDETRQVNALKAIGVLQENIFIDKSTGTTFLGRTEWEKLLIKVVVGDIIVIKELDRLGRNNTEIKETFELLNKKGVFLEFLEQPLLNTFGKSKIEMELLQPLVLHLLGYFAEKENEKRAARQAEAYAALPTDEKGRKKSRKTGRTLGRTNLYENLTSEQRKIIAAWTNKSIKTDDCLKLLQISRRSLYNLKKAIEGEEMELILLWEHHEMDGMGNYPYDYGFHKFTFKVKKKNTIIKDFIGKFKDIVLGKCFNLIISDDKFSVLYQLFKGITDFPSCYIVICPEANLRHSGYFSINEKKEITFYPIKKIPEDELKEKLKKVLHQ